MTLRSFLPWVIALVVTLGAAAVQRRTGPSYPMRGSVTLDSGVLPYSLPRSHGGEGDQEVSLAAPRDATADLFWRRYPSQQPWQTAPMVRNADSSTLAVKLPHQPPAGKLEYYAVLHSGAQNVRIPSLERQAVIRFRGDVPAWILAPHIVLMFAAMLVSNRAGLQALRKEAPRRSLTFITVGLLIIGGLMLGPLVQQNAFGHWWTGFPQGHDLTDNKAAIAVIVWLVPFVQALKNKPRKLWVLVAALIMLIVFLIPHSLLGSELKVE